ncbi:MAG: response regulator [Armatimonadota bacterium]|nr:response regulator [Armatimonadota bacterium]
MSHALSRILLVDDEPDIQAVARLALEVVGGFTVQVCSSGAAALQAAMTFAPDLILLDWMMPVMTGADVLKALRGCPTTAAIPVIFMTARVQPHEVAHYTDLGALAVLPKPFDPMTLAQTICAAWANAPQNSLCTP